MAVFCMKCGEEIHPLRLEILPNTRTCVSCSNVNKVAARIITQGQGEDISTELEFIEKETFKKITAQERGISFSEPISEDEEDVVENEYLKFQNLSNDEDE